MNLWYIWKTNINQLTQSTARFNLKIQIGKIYLLYTIHTTLKITINARLKTKKL